MERRQVLIVGAILLLVHVILVSANDNEKEPSPEPYSFGYNAESTGGFSSHQESGDGTGKVQGFYIIMGEDGRERRVDYVADENGYRASISTNEVGTRSESSADAQFNVQLPSQGQLEQAKVTVEEYKYLEEQHAAERERHLTNSNLRRQQQPPPQQQQQFNQNFERQQFAASGSNQSQSNILANNNNSRTLIANQRQVLHEQGNVAAQSADADEWRQRAAYANNLSVNQRQQQQQQQRQLTEQWAGKASKSQGFSSSESSNNQTSSEQAQQQPQQQQQQQQFGQLASATTSEQQLVSAINAPAPQRQQAQQAAWQLADRGVAPARLPNTNNNNFLQRQLEQQFMQQAFQLTNQDYPRQQQQQSAQQQLSKSNAIEYNNQYGDQEQQQQQQPGPSTADQPSTHSQQGKSIFKEARANLTGGPSNSPTWQRPWQINDNNDLDRVQLTGGDFNQNINQQQQQQQNNIIDEVSGDQVDAPQVLSTSDETSKGINGTYTTSTSLQLNPGGVKQTTNSIAQQQELQPLITTTSQSVAPSGFFSINLNQDNLNASAQNQQQLDQEVDSKQPQDIKTTFPSTTFNNGQRPAEQSVQTQLNTGDYQQVTVQQQQQQLVPNSIKQVIDSDINRQEGGSYIDSNQGKQQVSFQQNTLLSTSTQDSRPDTTTRGPESSLTSTTQQSKTNQEQQQQVIEASQAPNRFLDATITSTTTKEIQRPTVFQQQYVPTTTTPSRIIYETSSQDSLQSSNGFSSGFGSILKQSSSRRPAFQFKQQQQQVDGVKGGSRFVGNQREIDLTYQQTYSNKNNEPSNNLKTVSVIRPITESKNPVQVIQVSNNSAVTTSSGGKTYPQPTTITSESPQIIDAVTDDQGIKQIEYNQQLATQQQQKVPYQRPTLTFDNNRQQQQSVTSSATAYEIATSTPAPARVETNTQQQWKGGVKGGSRANRRQFWLQQQKPSIPSSQRVFQSGASQKLELPSLPNRASVDYAQSTSSFGSRILGR